MSLLSIVQYVCGRTNVPVPQAVMSSITDTQVLQMVRLLEEEGNDLSKRGAWGGITFEATHTTVGTEDQGAMTTIAANGFRDIRNGTFWDRTNKLPVMGPLSDQQWATLKGMATTGPRFHYRLRGGKLLVNPTPTAGYTWVFEYMSKNWILGADGTTYKQYFTLDTDTVLLPEDLLIMGVRWRWAREKGLAYAELFNTYETQVKDALGRDGGKAVLSMDHSTRDARPGIFVPDMSWNV